MARVVAREGPVYITQAGWRWEVYCIECRTGVQFDNRVEAEDEFDRHDHSERKR